MIEEFLDKFGLRRLTHDFEIKPEIDSIQSGDRGRIDLKTNELFLFVDNIWFDTQDYDKFVEGVDFITLIEICCASEANFIIGNQYCRRNYDKYSYDCIFLNGLREILKINYNFPSFFDWQDEVDRRIGWYER